ncbi:DUF6055 domain-containing protein [uncultured Muribaculum sp.]|uniref:DUF6055 domain-containing protein n=5 Tax=uncultured Muribaculum sp. TaxID=1918613 RepID=UPI002711F1FF|nr:DUF6055 domain-containing protein [uncultured Muribaculum sp.]
MIRHFLLAAVLLSTLRLTAEVTEYKGKSIYLPKELRDNDFTDPASKWSYDRMACTDNIVLFWAPGFGGNIATAPDLEGHNMKGDLANLLDRLESFYRFFYNDLAFVKPGTKADKYRMMVMLDYSLEGTAYGGDYDGEIGALWIAPNRVQDKKLNCIAHELGHSFQSQVSCDGEGEGWGGSGFFEMASQWMLWQVNPDWPTDENYHLNAYRDGTHKAFLHLDNIYRSPYVLELWGEKHGRPIIAELFRQGKRGEDPVITYKRINDMTQDEFNDEMFMMQRRLINWDIDRVRDNMRPYANLWHTDMVDAGGRYRVAPSNCPENYGFNAIALEVPAPGKKVTVDFKGEAGRKGYNSVNVAKAGWRYGLVAVDADGNATYGEMKRDRHGRIEYTAPADKQLAHLWLVVMGAPAEHWMNPHGRDNNEVDAQWPYSIKLSGTALRK